METAKKLAMLEEMMEMDDGTLKEDMVLSELESWDSMAKLSLIVLFDDEFGKTITGEDVAAFKTVQNILDKME